jgi:hypothetical protein
MKVTPGADAIPKGLDPLVVHGPSCILLIQAFLIAHPHSSPDVSSLAKTGILLPYE